MAAENEPGKLELRHGASWMDLEGNIYIVPGFHEEWLHANPEIVGGARSVADLILKKRWISIVLFGKGYVEICINDRKDREVVGLLERFLKANEALWTSALVMPLSEEEGFISLDKLAIAEGVDFYKYLESHEGAEPGAAVPP